MAGHVGFKGWVRSGSMPRAREQSPRVLEIKQKEQSSEATDNCPAALGQHEGATSVNLPHGFKASAGLVSVLPAKPSCCSLQGLTCSYPHCKGQAEVLYH